jgi:hypothetical protein
MMLARVVAEGLIMVHCGILRNSGQVDTIRWNGIQWDIQISSPLSPFAVCNIMGQTPNSAPMLP